MSKKQLTIAVTGLNNTDNPGPGIPFIRGLKEAKSFNARIIGLAYENLEPGIYMKDIVAQAAVNSRVEKSGMTSRDQQNVESLNKSQSIDPILAKSFDQQLEQDKSMKEAFYTMMSLRHPKEMERINNLDLAIEQETIRYKKAEKQGGYGIKTYSG